MKPAPGAELLRTERLILRRFTLEDTPAYFEMMNQPRVEATLVPGPRNLGEAGRQIAMIEGHWDLVGMSFLAVVERSTKLLVGRVGPWMPYGQPSPEIGWTIHPRRHRRGYALEAARASAHWLFNERPELDKIIHLILDSNHGSIAVASKLGGHRTEETIHHAVIGPIPIWETPKSAVL